MTLEWSLLLQCCDLLGSQKLLSSVCVFFARLPERVTLATVALALARPPLRSRSQAVDDFIKSQVKEVKTAEVHINMTMAESCRRRRPSTGAPSAAGGAAAAAAGAGHA